MWRAFYTVSPQGNRLAQLRFVPRRASKNRTVEDARVREGRAEGEVGNAMRTFDMNGPTDSRYRYRYRNSDVGRNRSVRARACEKHAS